MIELGVILALLMGWQFILGSPVTIVVLALLFRSVALVPCVRRAR